MCIVISPIWFMRGTRRRPTPHLGDQIHPRNRYKNNPPDFYALGQQYPEFRQYLRNVDDIKCRASLAWDDPFAVRELTKTLLLQDFGLKWHIPINRLCPPLPNRLNYLLWIEDLLTQARWDSQVEGDQPTPVISGIDVGTGANCIYALLGSTMNKWKFIATEIDVESYKCAKENVAQNQLEMSINVKQTYTNDLLLEALQDEPPERTFHFSMCNPPFFDNMNDADTNPESSCMGSANEMVFPGGEIAFIEKMITESEILQKRVLWYTSMVGKKSSLRKILALLRGKNVQSTRTTEFFQGRTKRWGIAWTFSVDLINDPSAKVLGKRKEAQRRQELSFQVSLKSDETLNGCTSIEEIHQRIREFVSMKDELTAEPLGDPKCEEKQELMVYNIKEFTLGEDVATKNNIKVRCAGRLEISNDKDMCNILAVFEEGDRAFFWTMIQTLQAAIVRTGRQWRRKLQRLKERN
ncbi:putative METTL16/RlmF family, S-adenosyl-L-methionine-dependent methyltransferase [Plasmopara halstedii]